MFGTSVFFRTHPKGQLGQAARAILWAAPPGAEVPGPSATTVTLSAGSPVAYPRPVRFDVDVAAAGGTPSGSVSVLDAAGRTVGTASLSGGDATVTVRGLRPGTRRYTASYTPDSPDFTAATSTAVGVRVTKAPSTTGLAVQRLSDRRVRITVRLAIEGLPSRGPVVVSDAGDRLRVVRFDGTGRTRSVVVRLGPGRHALRATYDGTALVRGSRSPVRTVAFRAR